MRSCNALLVVLGEHDAVDFRQLGFQERDVCLDNFPSGVLLFVKHIVASIIRLLTLAFELIVPLSLALQKLFKLGNPLSQGKLELGLVCAFVGREKLLIGQPACWEFIRMHILRCCSRAVGGFDHL